jgi:hypothetical protein
MTPLARTVPVGSNRSICRSQQMVSICTMERETGIEPATFSLGSGVGFILSSTYAAFFKIHEPIEPATCQARKNLDQIWTKVLILAERCAAFSGRSGGFRLADLGGANGE